MALNEPKYSTGNQLIKLVAHQGEPTLVGVRKGDVMTHKISKKKTGCQALAVKDIGNLTKALAQTSGDLVESCQGIEWEAIGWLQKVVAKKRSALIVGDDGCGKSVSVASVGDYLIDEGVLPIAFANDTPDIFMELWLSLERPLPRPSSFVRIDPQAKDLEFRCKNCRRNCLLCHQPGYLSWHPDLFDLQNAISNLSGDCPLIREVVYDNIEKFSTGVVLIRIPDVNNDLVALLSKLLDNGVVVMLGNSDQINQLRKLNRFRRLPCLRFPAPQPGIFLELFKDRLETAGMTTSPLTPEALVAAAMLSKLNIGRFIDLLGQVIFQIELEGASPPVNAEYILNQAATSLDDDTMIAFAVTQFSGWTRTEDIANAILSIFGQTIELRSLAHRLKAMGFEGKHTPYSKFKIIKLKLKTSDTSNVGSLLRKAIKAKN